MSGTAEHAAAGAGDRNGPPPAQLLDEMRVIRDRTSAAARGYWLPLLLFGALICGSLPFYERLARSRPGVAGPPASAPCQAVVNQPLAVQALRKPQLVEKIDRPLLEDAVSAEERPIAPAWICSRNPAGRSLISANDFTRFP